MRHEAQPRRNQYKRTVSNLSCATARGNDSLKSLKQRALNFSHEKRARHFLVDRNDDQSTATHGNAAATADDVIRLFGELEGALVAEILDHLPTLDMLKETYAWLVREGHIMALQGRTTVGGIAGILEYIKNGDAQGEQA